MVRRTVRSRLITISPCAQVDIMFLFDEGHLVDFTSTELIKLVRALFAESPNRAKAIETIRAGRPSAPA